MADVVQFLYSFPPEGGSDGFKSNVEYDRQIRSFLQALSQIPAGTLASGIPGNRDLLELLDPSVNTLSYLAVLVAQIQQHNERPKTPRGVSEACRPPGGALWRRITHFLTTFDPIQVRYVGGEFRRVIEYADRIARLTDTIRDAVAPVRAAMMRLDQTTATFTSTHLLFIRLCLEARAFRDALPVLDNTIQGFPGTVTPGQSPLPCADHPVSSGYITQRSNLSDKIAPADVHEFFLLGAIIYLAVGSYQRALLYLEHVFTAPTQNAPTGHMLEAYRKWVLVRCLVDSSPLTIPKTANAVAMKHIRAASKAYETVADLFRTSNLSRLQLEVEAGAVIWYEDGNEGLIRLVIRQHSRTFVANLQKVYAAIPVPSVAGWLLMSDEEAEVYLNSLILDGQLNASVETNPSCPSILCFYPELTGGPLAKSEAQRYDELARQIERTNELAGQVKAADQRLKLSKEYVEYVSRRNKKDAVGEEAMDMSWDAMEQQDEDMMADLR